MLTCPVIGPSVDGCPICPVSDPSVEGWNCLQVFPRDLAHPSPALGDDDSDQPLADETDARLRAAAPGLFQPPFIGF